MPFIDIGAANHKALDFIKKNFTTISEVDCKINPNAVRTKKISFL
ncbi:hypothetical protein LSAJ18_40001 [Latilactobacillus sakei]|nr:hypothetical protein LSAJ18_40001 [Latilactobacillus sakei]